MPCHHMPWLGLGLGLANPNPNPNPYPFPNPNPLKVILSRIFPTKLTAGYSAMMDRRCISVNGEAVLNLRQMYPQAG